MAHVALVSYDVQAVGGRNGGVGSTNTHLARLLKDEGENVTIVFVTGSARPVAVDPEWKARYAGWGIGLLELHNPMPAIGQWRRAWPARLSEQIAPHLNRFDIVYLQDWANPGFHAIRQGRHFLGSRPLFVTVLHGPSEWIRAGNRRLPNIPEDLEIEFMERYSAEKSDWIIAPSRYMSDWVQRRGWKFRREPEVLGIPYLPYVKEEPGADAPRIDRIILFGRLEVRKGFDLFRDALGLLCAQQPEVLGRIREVVLLGVEQEPGSVAGLRRALSATGLPVTHLSFPDSLSAIRHLAGQASNALVVIPSPFENFPSSVIETLSIRGLNVICSRGGGIPEVFGRECEAQLFEPFASALAAKIAERLSNPLRADQLAEYDFDAANDRWVQFHRRACAHRKDGPRSSRRPSVDVCISYYNKGAYLGQLLRALEAQTEKCFGVIAVDDGSTDPGARRVFDEAAAAYAGRGWQFLRQPNAFVDAARNRAAKAAAAEFLLFVDADDVPAPDAIERLLDGALASGVDCLGCGGYAFDSEEIPGAQNMAGMMGFLPLGPDLVCGMVDPMVFGPPMILIRRAVFEKIGGYRECRGANHEDWELQVRLLNAGYKTDVLPERLLFFRRSAGGLTMTGEPYAAKRRLIESYSEALRPVGMSGLASVVVQLNQRCLELQEKLRENIPLELRLQLHDVQNVEPKRALC